VADVPSIIPRDSLSFVEQALELALAAVLDRLFDLLQISPLPLVAVHLAAVEQALELAMPGFKPGILIQHNTRVSG